MFAPVVVGFVAYESEHGDALVQAVPEPEVETHSAPAGAGKSASPASTGWQAAARSAKRPARMRARRRAVLRRVMAATLSPLPLGNASVLAEFFVPSASTRGPPLRSAGVDLTAEEVKALLGLEPHPTCGFVAETYRSTARVDV